MRHICLLMGLVLVLGGCGFKLRGPAELPYRLVKINGHPFEPVVREITHQLKVGRQTVLVERLEEAEMVIEILETERDEEIISLGRTGHVQAYEYQLWVRYQLCGAQGKQCLPEAVIELSRQMSYDEGQILAKRNEERLLQRDMNQEAARLILLNASSYRPIESETTLKKIRPEEG